jgi:hypothetical protein
MNFSIFFGILGRSGILVKILNKHAGAGHLAAF